VSAYCEIAERLAVDVSFLWLLRAIAINQPNYRRLDIIAIDQRIEAQFDGLLTAPEEAWNICFNAIDVHDSGEIFAAAVLAFSSMDVVKIRQVVERGMANKHTVLGLASALAWLPEHICHRWIKKFFTSKDLNHKYLAVVACSLRRDNPGDYLTSIFQRKDCIAHELLYARALRLVGELKRRDLSLALSIALQSDKPATVFWAAWSSVLLGEKSAVKFLRPFVLTKSLYQVKAIELAFRVLPISEAHNWIAVLAKDPEQIRNVIKSSAVLGDPQVINWLIEQMRIPILARLAGEAFSTITGVDLDDNRLALSTLPKLLLNGPNEDPQDSDVSMDEDEHLPFPNVDKIATVWSKYQQSFSVGSRYFMGKSINEDDLVAIFKAGNQRQRRAAAFELALLKPAQLLLHHAAKEAMVE